MAGCARGQVWDTNALRPACDFVLPERVHAVAMSRCATAHCLVRPPSSRSHTQLQALVVQVDLRLLWCCVFSLGCGLCYSLPANLTVVVLLCTHHSA